MVDATTSVPALRERLLNRSASIAERTRAAFWLRERKHDAEARRALRSALLVRTDSALLRHELAYILGQVGHADAVDDLCAIVRDVEDEAVVRHEAAEALGAIGDARAIATLRVGLDDVAPEVRETCRLALDLFAWRDQHTHAPNATFLSLDPAPPAAERSLDSLETDLVDGNSLWCQYQALFALRDLATRDAVDVLSRALVLPRNKLPSDLLRHELAFVLGQLARDASAPALETALRDTTMHPMVRHEAAEALGALDPPTAAPILSTFLSDRDAIVAQSCQVALDAMAYYQQQETPPVSS
ncbi:hypothetical protein CTAYLR_006493 [Chrysophaeum taylorii]|uniref:Deoxyhypusine hydroxylase n=1 Tax=Chrysophaeum taylorii TaxID=2483200 RepID=A0AAD7ULC9_9STRA|nr:hypothetical protein CTAYLR_006493 [Chrysophaeum taylorii]